MYDFIIHINKLAVILERYTEKRNEDNIGDKI